MGDRIAKTVVEFKVDGVEDYNPVFTFGNTRPEMVAIVEEIFNGCIAELDKIFAEPTSGASEDKTVTSVELKLHVAGKPPVEKKWPSPTLAQVVAAERALIVAQTAMLDKSLTI